jgi:hypothetical protein
MNQFLCINNTNFAAVAALLKYCSHLPAHAQTFCDRKTDDLRPCHDCGKDVITNEKALSCSICENWYHIKCQKVPILDYDFLLKSDDNIQWICKVVKGHPEKFAKY